MVGDVVECLFEARSGSLSHGWALTVLIASSMKNARRMLRDLFDGF